MCGICGVVGVEQPGAADSLVRRMTAAMEHRGPDDEGFLAGDPRAPGTALGMRRLSIIDLPGGHQPIFNETRDAAVILNGEIYNFGSLRQTLELCGHTFRTRSDTEVLLHGWEEWGLRVTSELRGMFAFAVLDLRPQNDFGEPALFLARDPLGIKPLYYSWQGDVLLFASEVRALLASGIVPRRLSWGGLESYLLFGSVAEPATLVDTVFSLPPGHQMVVPLRGHTERPPPAAYWDLAHIPSDSPSRGPRDFQAAVRALRPRLEEAVRSHLIADVPVGLFLSSGMDSSAIAALAGRERAGIHSFTVAFPEQEFNEAPLARRVAERCGTRHEEVPLSGAEMLARIEESLDALDQPTMDGINTYMVSWAARQVGLKVALSGLGGDEVFGGYPTFQDVPRAARLAGIARALPRPLRRGAAAAAERWLARGPRADAVRKMASLACDPDALPHAYYYLRALFPPQQASRLGVPSDGSGADANRGLEEILWRIRLRILAQASRTGGALRDVSRLELRSYMANTLLRDTDSVSMNRSLEVRVPLLDTPLVEFVEGLPEKLRDRRGAKKALLAEAMGDLLPREVIAQRKRTFTLPWEHWLRGPLRARVEAGLTSPAPALAPHLRGDATRAVWNDFLAGRTSWSRPWALFVLNEWCARHLGRQEP